MMGFDGIVTGGSDNTVKMWDVHTGTLTNTLVGHEKPITAIIQIVRDLFATTSQDNSIRVWNTYGAQVMNLTGHTEYVEAITLINATTIASGSRDNTIKVWNLQSGKCTHTIKERYDVNTLLYHNEANMLISGSDDRIVRCYSVDQKLVKELKGHMFGVTSLCELQHDREHLRLASGSADRTIRIWDINSGVCINRIETTHKDDIVKILNIGYNLIASCGDKNILIHDVASGKLIKTLEGHTEKVTSICMIDSDTIASTSKDGTIKTWSIGSGQVLLSSVPMTTEHFNCIERIHI
ncbi:hypothetical protein AKO1_011805 [Acrasis kona]|uniref:Uncharacterized protein n=1 Tax=Acrasis kona TaxID=1008807 RepID=A0AAW2Z6H9_9EUKA